MKSQSKLAQAIEAKRIKTPKGKPVQVLEIVEEPPKIKSLPKN